MLARLSAFVTWALVAATVVFWALRLLVQAAPAPSYVVAVGEGVVARGDLTRLLGAPVSVAAAGVAAVPEASSSRFKLLGVMAPRAGSPASEAGRGVALMTIDGKMAKAYAVGAHVDADLVLQSVSLRSASIGPAQGAATYTLELARPAPAATGTLPVGGAFSNNATPIPMTPMPYGAPGTPQPGTSPVGSGGGGASPGVPVSPLQINPGGAGPGNRMDSPPPASQ